jgi:DNA helicase-2/ATP-dependent DNA helicase PcrA
MLIRKNKKLCVVGDDAQSIYAFRGAVLANILNFQNEYDNAKIFKLEQNYRSTKNIIDAANSVISNNKNQIKKKIWTENKKGEKCFLLKSLTEAEEAKSVANLIWNEVKEQKSKYSDFAILFRTNNQTTTFESEMGMQRIPYKIVGNISFYQRKEIKDFLAYLRVFVNKDDTESILRTINFPKRGIGEQSLKRIFNIAKKENLKVWDLICRSAMFFEKRFSNLIQEYSCLVKCGTELAENKNAYEAATYLFNHLKDSMFKEDNEAENVKNLLYNIEQFVKNNEDKSLLNYINKTPLIVNEDLENAEDWVSLMTVHSAKGLEFKNVFIVGVEEKLFPSESAIFSGEVEDERRLFYVAMTRAKEKLFISYVSNRFLYGNLILSKKSRFIDEIASDCWDNMISPKKNSGYYSLGKLYRSNYYDVGQKTKELVLNSKVYHPLFAKYGQIKNFRKVQNQTIVDIEFEDEKTVSIAENVLTLFNN